MFLKLVDAAPAPVVAPANVRVKATPAYGPSRSNPAVVNRGRRLTWNVNDAAVHEAPCAAAGNRTF